MSTLTAKQKLMGHGRVLCRKCNKVIVSCRCMDCSKNIKYDLCDACENSPTKATEGCYPDDIPKDDDKQLPDDFIQI